MDKYTKSWNASFLECQNLGGKMRGSKAKSEWLVIPNNKRNHAVTTESVFLLILVLLVALLYFSFTGGQTKGLGQEKCVCPSHSRDVLRFASCSFLHCLSWCSLRTPPSILPSSLSKIHPPAYPRTYIHFTASFFHSLVNHLSFS